MGDNGRANQRRGRGLLPLDVQVVAADDRRAEIRHGADFFLVEGTYASDAGKRETIVCSFSRKGGKVLKRNGKEYERLSDHVGLIPAVIGVAGRQRADLDAADERRRYQPSFRSWTAPISVR
ncbi:MAG: hypothetical protein ACLRM8_04660 [Alistipes sp.]